MGLLSIAANAAKITQRCRHAELTDDNLPQTEGATRVSLQTTELKGTDYKSAPAGALIDY